MAGVAGVLILHLLLLVKLKFTAWPEMILWPYLINHGWLPYRDIAIAHTPKLIFDLSIFYRLFGTGVIQLQIFTWVLIIISDLIIYFVAKKLWGNKVAIISLIFYALLSIFFDGNGLWFDLFLVPFAVFSYFLTVKKKYFWLGIVFAFMFLTKQTAVWFLIPIFFAKVDYKKFFTGILTVLIIFFILMVLLGLLPSFYYWAFHFGIFILPSAEGQVLYPGLRSLFAAGFPFLIFLPLLFRKKPNLNLFLWAIAGSLGAYPRFEYFHFQPAIPFLSFAGGIVFSEFGKLNKKIKSALIVYVFILTSLFGGFFVRNWNEGVRFYDASVIDVSNYIKENARPGDRIFVMNWWDNIYPLTGTIPATKPWVPQLSWYQELPGVQEKEVADMTIDPPKLVILQDYSESGLSSYVPGKIYAFVMENYKLKDKIDGINIFVHK